MRERINRLAKGIIDFDRPLAIPEPLAIELPVRAGEIVKSEICISSSNKVHIKGLAYSSNSRVHILKIAFGGLKNHINYEVDSRYLIQGETIIGTFSFVTNGGETEVPYIFTVMTGAAEKTFSNLKTKQDFALIAKEDPETALRLFEYKDFTTALFLKNIKFCALHTAFMGRPNRANALEEFLVALDAKHPVDIQLNSDKIIINCEDNITYNCIDIKQSNSGYLSIDVKSVGDFILLENNILTEEKFIDGIFQLEFLIEKIKLHKGINYGSIILNSIKKDYIINIEAVVNDLDDIDYIKDSLLYHKKHIYKYIKYRLIYEYNICDKKIILENMISELNCLSTYKDKKNYITLLKAEAMILSNQEESAMLLIDSVSEDVKLHRQEQIQEYFLLEYIKVVLYKQVSKKESLIRLIRKFIKEEHMHFLFIYLIKLDKSLLTNKPELMDIIRSEYNSGNRSPFLYLELCRVLNYSKEFLHDLGSMELHALFIGARHKMISKELSYIVAVRAKILKSNNKLYYPMLKLLYDVNPCRETLYAVCSVLIRGDNKSQSIHNWYHMGIQEQLGIVGLHEYFMYSLSSDYKELLPTEIIDFFENNDAIDIMIKSVLYENIVLYMTKDDKSYDIYRPRIEAFMLEQLLLLKIDSHLANIYKYTLKKEMINLELAKVLPTILNSYLIICKRNIIKSVVIIYPELNKEDIYNIDNSKVYVPFFSDNAIILFQDAYNNRYYDIDFSKTAIFNMPELIDRCYELYPEHIMLRLNKIDEILRKNEIKSSQIAIIENTLYDMPLSEQFKKTLLSVLVEYYKRDNNVPFKSDFLVMVDKDIIDQKERTQVCNALIKLEYFKEAFEMIKIYGCEDIETDNLKKLCTRSILERLFTEDELLLYLANKVIIEGCYENVILDYLCEHYNGNSDNMFKILEMAIYYEIETYDMEERLLVQMIFSGDNIHIDTVFEWYANRKKTGENIVKAYFNLKSTEYVLFEKHVDIKVFNFIENIISHTMDKEKIPLINKLAITMYYSTLSSLDETQKSITKIIIDNFINSGFVFPYYKKLSNFIDIPRDIMDKEIIIYRSINNAKVEYKTRILPQEQEFRTEAISPLYEMIYVKSKVLFAGETWEYKIYEYENDIKVLKKEESLRYYNVTDNSYDSRFACLNMLHNALETKDDIAVENGMKKFITMEEQAKQLFKLM